MRKDFYNYILWRDGIPFYVGKGCGKRINSHESCARLHERCRHLTCRVIRKVWRDGGTFEKTKPYENLAEQEAHANEIELIEFGREQGWPLVNQTIGGEGVSGYKWTPEQREMRRQIVLREMEEQQERYHRFIYANIGRKHDPEVEARRVKSIKEAWSVPALVEDQRARQLKRWSDPEEIERQRQRMRDPELVARNSAKNKGHKRKALTYQGFVSPDGTVYKNVHDLAAFCKVHGLQKSNMCLVNQGKQKAHKGWTKYIPDPADEI